MKLEVKDDASDDPSQPEIEFKLSAKKRFKGYNGKYICDRSNSYSCDQCHFRTSSTKVLEMYISKQHMNLPIQLLIENSTQGVAVVANDTDQTKVKQELYNCDKCCFNTKHKVLLKRHKEWLHEGVAYQCEKCEYMAASLSGIEEHKENKHFGVVKYPCNECDYTVTQEDALKQHMTKQHGHTIFCDNYFLLQFSNESLQQLEASSRGAIKFRCKKCDFVTLTFKELRMHKFNNHDDVEGFCRCKIVKDSQDVKLEIT